SFVAIFSLLSPSLFSRATLPPWLYSLSLHDALPISLGKGLAPQDGSPPALVGRIQIWNSVVVTGSTLNSAWRMPVPALITCTSRSEEHTSELQSREMLVCRLLLEKT